VKPVVIEDAEDLTAPAGSVVVDDDAATSKKVALPERAIRNDDGTITLPLIKPVTLTIKNAGGQREETYDALTFREMTGLNLRMIAQAPPEKQTVVALAQATGIKQHRMDPLFDNMLARDVTAAAAVISFLQE
jgi:hypothetical protein